MMLRTAYCLTIIIILITYDTMIIAVIQKMLGCSIFIVHRCVY